MEELSSVINKETHNIEIENRTRKKTPSQVFSINSDRVEDRIEPKTIDEIQQMFNQEVIKDSILNLFEVDFSSSNTFKHIPEEDIEKVVQRETFIEDPNENSLINEKDEDSRISNYQKDIIISNQRSKKIQKIKADQLKEKGRKTKRSNDKPTNEEELSVLSGDELSLDRSQMKVGMLLKSMKYISNSCMKSPKMKSYEKYYYFRNKYMHNPSNVRG